MKDIRLENEIINKLAKLGFCNITLAKDLKSFIAHKENKASIKIDIIDLSKLLRS